MSNARRWLEDDEPTSPPKRPRREAMAPSPSSDATGATTVGDDQSPLGGARVSIKAEDLLMEEIPGESDGRELSIIPETPQPPTPGQTPAPENRMRFGAPFPPNVHVKLERQLWELRQRGESTATELTTPPVDSGGTTAEFQIPDCKPSRQALADAESASSRSSDPSNVSSTFIQFSTAPLFVLAPSTATETLTPESLTKLKREESVEPWTASPSTSDGTDEKKEIKEEIKREIQREELIAQARIAGVRRGEAPSPPPGFHVPESFLNRDISLAPPEQEPVPEPRLVAPVRPSASMDVDSDDDLSTTPEDSESDSGSEGDREVARVLTPGPSPKQSEPIARPPSVAKRGRCAPMPQFCENTSADELDERREDSTETEEDASEDTPDQESEASESEPEPRRPRQPARPTKATTAFITSGGKTPADERREKEEKQQERAKKNARSVEDKPVAEKLPEPDKIKYKPVGAKGRLAQKLNARTAHLPSAARVRLPTHDPVWSAEFLKMWDDTFAPAPVVTPQHHHAPASPFTEAELRELDGRLVTSPLEQHARELGLGEIEGVRPTERPAQTLEEAFTSWSKNHLALTHGYAMMLPSAYRYSSYIADTTLLAALGIHDIDPFSFPPDLVKPRISPPQVKYFYGISEIPAPTLLIDLLPGRSHETAAKSGLLELCADALLPEPAAGTGFRGLPELETAIEDEDLMLVIMNLFDPDSTMEPEQVENLICTIMDTNQLWYYHIYQLARIRMASDNLALPKIIEPLGELHVQQKNKIEEEIRKLKQERMALNTYVREREPHAPGSEFHRHFTEIDDDERKWKKKLFELRDGMGALLDRLQRRAKAFDEGRLEWDLERVDGL